MSEVTDKRGWQWVRRAGIALAVLLAVLALALGWLGWTSAGLRFALARAQQATGGALHWQQARGAVFRSLQLDGVRYDDGRGTAIRVDHLRLDLRFWPLLVRRVHVLALDVGNVQVALPKAGEDTGSSSTFSLRPPLDFVIDHAHVGAVAVTVAGAPVFASDRLDLAGRWTRAGLAFDTLQLQAPDGHVDLSGRLALGQRERGHGKAAFSWRTATTTWAGQLDADADGRQAHVALALTAPFAATFKLDVAQDRQQAWQARLDAPAFDPAPLLGDSALHEAGITLTGRGDRRGGSIEGALTANGYRVDVAPLEVTHDARRATWRMTRLAVRSPQIKGQLDATGELALGTTPWHAQASLVWRDVSLPAALAGQVLASSGSLSAAGSVAHYTANARFALGPPAQPVQLTVALDGTPQALTLRTFDAQQGRNRLQASGQLDLAPGLGWQLTASASGFNPGAWLADWPGALDVALTTKGQATAHGLDATLDISRLDGRLRGRTVNGSARLHLSPARVLAGELRLRAGSGTVQLDARPGAANDADVRLAVASLGDWLPDAGGRLDGQFNLRGHWPRLAVNGQLRGDQLAWQGQHVARLHLIAGVPDVTRPAGKVDLQAGDLRVGTLDFSQLHLLAEGSERNHRLDIHARGEPLSVRLALRGAEQDDRWSGTLDTLDVDAFGMPRWRLQQRSRLAWRSGTFTASDVCLTAGAPVLCVSGHGSRNGQLQASYRLQNLPAALALDAAGASDWRVDAVLDGSGQVQRDARGTWRGDAALRTGSGKATWLVPDNPPALGWSSLTVRAETGGATQSVDIHAALDHGGVLAAHAALRGRTQALSGQVELKLPDIAPFAQIGEVLANAHGAASAQLALHGTLAQPGVSGQATITGFTAEVPAAGITLKQGALTATTLDGNRLQLAGQAQSGDGTLHVAGDYALGDGGLALTLRGQQFRAADIPGASIVVSPDLVLAHTAAGLTLGGRLALDRAEVNLDRLPGLGGAGKASPDVVVVDRPQPPPATALPIHATVAVDLGQHTHLIGFGLDGRLHGTLTVSEQPGRAATGQGQITVDGSYKAYGQELHIERGRLLFAGTPLDNPGLALRATRKLNPNATVDEGQQVGLDIAGTAQRPVLTVFSQPPMEQSDALSYLVTGKPLSQVKGGEGDMLGSAAQALGSAAGNLLAKRIGSELGIDDIGVGASDALGGESAFTVGKFLSPRLYLSYGVGLFQPGEVVTLRYRISHRWHVEAQSATNFNRASLNYRREK